MTNEEKILAAITQMQGDMAQFRTETNARFDKMGARFDKLEADISGVRVLVDVDIEKKLNLLAEGQQTLLDTLAPKSRVEALEEEVSTLKTVIRILAEKVDSLTA